MPLDVGALRTAQTGAVLTPDDPGYAAAVGRWSPSAAPDVLVRPRTPEDVGAAVRWAADQGLELGVGCGGHGPWNALPGGLLVDLGELTDVRVDGERVTIGGGLTWGEVAVALEPHGLVVSSGDTRGVGVGGNTLGAGVGWLLRSVGLAVDQLRAVDLVTADGRLVRAAADENPELFFAVRGGGGNLGVATSFEFHARRLPHVVHGTAGFGLDRLADVVRGVRDAMRTAPRDLQVTLAHVPPMGPAAPAATGVLELFWAGDDETAARAALEPLLALPGVETPKLEVVPYAETLKDGPPPSSGPAPRMPGSNGVFRHLPDDIADRAAQALSANPLALFEIRFLGGAFADVPADQTAIAWRDAEALLHWFVILPPTASDDDVVGALTPWSPVRDAADWICGTFTQERSPDLVPRMYPPATLERLRAVKRAYDPDNVFHRNHTVEPA